MKTQHDGKFDGLDDFGITTIDLPENNLPVSTAPQARITSDIELKEEYDIFINKDVHHTFSRMPIVGISFE